MKTIDEIFGELRTEVENGARFSFNFAKRTLYVNGKCIIRDGKFADDEVQVEQSDASVADVLAGIEIRYNMYKHSIPNATSDRIRSPHFKALKYDELTDDDRDFGLPRHERLFNLEWYVMMNILNGVLDWSKPEFRGKWFWKSPKDFNLVIRKEWIAA